MKSTMTHRYIARFVVEAQTALFVGSGEASLLKDALVQKDHNGLPMIQGTSLMGVIRHALEDANPNSNIWDDLLGYQNKDNNEGKGSRIIISSAYMLISKNNIANGLLYNVPDNIKSKYDNLPSRQHVRITDKGAAIKGGLFDNEVVYKGTRFVFELELKGNYKDKHKWETLLNTINSPIFRIGQGTRNGYGCLGVIACENREFDLENDGDFSDYLAYDSSFSKLPKQNHLVSNKNVIVTSYKLELEPDSFFIFNAGFGDDDADYKPLEEEVAIYNENGIDFRQNTLIPGSSIKGAIAHRVCFHYNKLTKQYADEGNGTKGIENKAVYELFGAEKDGKEKGWEKQRGQIIIDDLYYDETKVKNDKIFNHVAIDRFTGGAMDGALFSEKVSYKKDKQIELTVTVAKSKKGFAEHVEASLEAALQDICKGLLPLGGMTTKGHGVFTGTLYLNTQKIYSYHE
jgi:CRISPR/Cas system CSM-associated protein Csm3 (group 7 of RAMP superfamily)